jgi:hypothetical protein
LLIDPGVDENMIEKERKRDDIAESDVSLVLPLVTRQGRQQPGLGLD